MPYHQKILVVVTPTACTSEGNSASALNGFAYNNRIHISASVPLIELNSQRIATVTEPLDVMKSISCTAY